MKYNLWFFMNKVNMILVKLVFVENGSNKN